MGYLICKECSGIYELQDGESPNDFDVCYCGGKLEYYIPSKELESVQDEYREMEKRRRIYDQNNIYGKNAEELKLMIELQREMDQRMERRMREAEERRNRIQQENMERQQKLEQEHMERQRQFMERQQKFEQERIERQRQLEQEHIERQRRIDNNSRKNVQVSYIRAITKIITGLFNF